MFTRLTSSPEELQAEELRQDAAVFGCTPIAETEDREVVTVSGTLRTVTLRPRAVCRRWRPSSSTGRTRWTWSGWAAARSRA